MYAKHLTLCQMYKWNLINDSVLFWILCTKLTKVTTSPQALSCATCYICGKPDLRPWITGLTLELT